MQFVSPVCRTPRPKLCSVRINKSIVFHAFTNVSFALCPETRANQPSIFFLRQSVELEKITAAAAAAAAEVAKPQWNELATILITMIPTKGSIAFNRFSARAMLMLKSAVWLTLCLLPVRFCFRCDAMRCSHPPLTRILAKGLPTIVMHYWKGMRYVIFFE